MRSFAFIASMLLSICVYGQLSAPRQITASPQGIPVSKADYLAAKNRGTQNQRQLQNTVLDYGGVNEFVANDSTGTYSRFVWDLNSNYDPSNPNLFALTWGVVRFDTLFDFNTMTPYPRNSTPVTIDSVRTFFTHQNITQTPDTIQISVYEWQGTAGIQVNAQEEITNTVLWDTMIITTTSLTASGTTLGILTVRPGITLNYPNNRFSVGVHFYGDTANTFTILAGYADYCGQACQAATSVFELNSLWRIIAWAGTTNLTGINSVAYNCDGDGVIGEPEECEEFPIQDFAIVSYVTLDPVLTASVSGPVAKCPNQSVSLSVTAAGGTPPYNYNWSPTTGLSSSTSANPTTNVNSTTVYNVTVTDGAGGSVTRSVTVTVNGITINAGNDQQLGCGQTANLTATPGGVLSGATFQWNNGVNTLNNPGVNPGTYTITATNSFGCSATDQVAVTVANITQVLNFTTSLTNNTGCVSDIVQFTNTSAHQSGWNWLWTFGDNSGNISTAQSPAYQYSTPGVFTVTLATDSAGCTVASATKTINISSCVACPDPNITVPGYHPSPAAWPCVEQGVPYSQDVQINIPASFDTVIFGNPLTITIDSVTIDSIGGLPAGFTYSCASTCTANGGGTICLTISGTTNAATGQYPLVISSTAALTMPILGQQTQVGDLDDFMQSNTYLNVINNGAPCVVGQLSATITASPSGPVCSGQSVTLTVNATNTSGTVFYQWSSGSSAQSFIVQPSATTTYTVTVTDANGSVTANAVVQVTPATASFFTYSAAGTTLSFTDGSSNNPTAWAWTFGDGNTSTQRNPSHTYANAGTYNVCLTATNSCGSNQSCQNITVTSGCTSPVASYTYSASGTTLSFTDNSSNTPTSWSWTFGDGNTSTVRNPNHTYSATGTYSVCLTATNSCGSNQSCQNITVTSGCTSPVASYTYSASGTTLSFTDNSSNTPTSWSWIFGDGGTSTQRNPSHTYANAGTYTVCVTATNSCGSNQSCQNITVTSGCNSPVAAYTHTAAGTTVTFVSTSSNNPTAWSWTFGDGGSSAQSNPTHTYATGGNYSVCLTATNSCGADTECGTITVTCPAPVATYTYTVAGTSVSFVDNSTNTPTAWAWTFGDGLLSTTQNPVHTYTTTGTFTACVTAINACGSDTACQSITLNCNINAAITTNSATPCTGDTALLVAPTGSNYSYQWYRAGVLIQNATASTYQTTQNGSYTVAISNGICSATSAPLLLNFVAPPQVTVSSSGSTTFCAGGSVTLNATPGFVSYLWNDNSTSSSLTATESGTFTVTATDANGCTGSGVFLLNTSTQSPPDLCIVGVDSATGSNILVWEKPVTASIDSYVVYKETNQTNVFVRIGAQPYNAFSTFIDNASNPQQQAYRYQLGIIDSCGSATLPGAYHKTIHLTINQGVGTTWNLIWSHYEGINFSSYDIYRGTSASNLSLLTTIAGSLSSYTDLTPPGGTVYYQIGIVNPNNCVPTAKTTDYGVSKSNIVNSGMVGIGNIAANARLKIYPNPFTETATIEIPEAVQGAYDLRIVDLLGADIKVMQNLTDRTVQLNRDQLANGIYFIEVRADKRYFGKVVLE